MLGQAPAERHEWHFASHSPSVVGPSTRPHAAPLELGGRGGICGYKHDAPKDAHKEQDSSRRTLARADRLAPTPVGGYGDGAEGSAQLRQEVRQEKLGCSEGESPSRLMETSVFRTKEMNGKV